AAIAALALVLSVPAAAQSGTFTLTSKEVAAGKQIPLPQVFGGMGCTGKNVSPSLMWHGAPAGTKSFAAGAGDASKKLLPAGAVQGNTDFGAPGYGGPCPPAGDKPHHYIFTLYALKTDKLDLPAGATAAYVGFNIHANELGKAT